MKGTKGKGKIQEESNPSVVNKLNRKKLRCSICPPNKGENAKRQARHGNRKPRYKDKR
jgi:hypothetical protein